MHRPPRRVFGTRLREMHDVTGYDRDRIGEAALLAVTCRQKAALAGSPSSLPSFVDAHGESGVTSER